MCLKQKIGLTGENLAVKYLKENNYKIIKRNFRCRQGEIDIIAYDKTNKELVFVEVKTRSNTKFGRPSEAVQNLKQKHIKKVAQYYNYNFGIKNQAIRFDVIEVFLNDNNYKVEHIIQAFI